MFGQVNVNLPLIVGDNDNFVGQQQVGQVVDIAPLVNYINLGVQFLIPVNQYLLLNEPAAEEAVNQEADDEVMVVDDHYQPQQEQQHEQDMVQQNDFQDMVQQEDLHMGQQQPQGHEIEEDNNDDGDADSGYWTDADTIRDDPDYQPPGQQIVEEGENVEEHLINVYRSVRYNESRQHRLLDVKKLYWRKALRELRLVRDSDLNRTQRRIRRIRRRRQALEPLIPVHRRRRLQEEDENIDRPRRNHDICWGCSKPFYIQRIRMWERCADCGLWLCPDCAAEPIHCQNENLLF